MHSTPLIVYWFQLNCDNIVLEVVLRPQSWFKAAFLSLAEDHVLSVMLVPILKHLCLPGSDKSVDRPNGTHAQWSSRKHTNKSIQRLSVNQVKVNPFSRGRFSSTIAHNTCAHCANVSTRGLPNLQWDSGMLCRAMDVITARFVFRYPMRGQVNLPSLFYRWSQP